jgi:hypothetical protein
VRDTRIFISYASLDGGEHAARLDRELRAHQVLTWLEPRDIDESFDFTAQLELAIEAATAVIAPASRWMCADPTATSGVRSRTRRPAASAWRWRGSLRLYRRSRS